MEIIGSIIKEEYIPRGTLCSIAKMGCIMKDFMR